MKIPQMMTDDPAVERNISRSDMDIVIAVLDKIPELSEVPATLGAIQVLEASVVDKAGEVAANTLTVQSETATTVSNATSALASKNAAELSEINASNSANSASIYKDNALASAVSANASAQSALDSKDSANLSAVSASTSESIATQKALEASVSASTAMTSETNASLSASNANTSEVNSLLSEQNALQSETNAAISETNALNSAEIALAQSNIATTKATESSISAFNALTSETNAHNSEVNASTSEANTLTYKNQAESFKSTSEVNATIATNKATEASISADTATTQANIATTKSNDASISASNALVSETNASNSANIATNASVVSSSSAQASADSAVLANQSAGSASISATTATTKASEASVSASEALSYKDIAVSAANSITNMQVATGLPNSAVTWDGTTLTIPKSIDGIDGIDGTSIVSVIRTSGTGLAGSTDVYTITLTDSNTHEFSVYNGTDSDINSSDLAAIQSNLLTTINQKLNISDVINNLTSSFADKALSAAQGKVLKDLIDNINTLLSSDDMTLDQMQEIVNYIKQNKADLQNLDLSNIAETTIFKHFTATLKTKLDGIATGANNYSHPIGDGNVHIPANGTTNTDKYLQATGTAGVYTWATIPATTLATLGVTATAAELNKLNGATVTTTELNILDGVTVTATQLNYLSALSGNVQTQLNAKAALASPALTGTPTAPTATVGTNNTQIATTAFVLANGGALPSGFIGMWSGSIASIPNSWALCDGTNGTPDLRDRFVIGSSVDVSGVSNTGVTGANTKTGGSQNAIIVSHTHTQAAHSHTGSTNSTGAHTHTTALHGSSSPQSNITAAGDPNITRGASTTSTSGAHTHTVSIENATPTIGSTGSSGTNANLPPYYALAFIMKL